MAMASRAAGLQSVEAQGVCWVIDGRCLLCLCFTGSRCHYRVAVALSAQSDP